MKEAVGTKECCKTHVKLPQQGQGKAQHGRDCLKDASSISNHVKPVTNSQTAIHKHMILQHKRPLLSPWPQRNFPSKPPHCCSDSKKQVHLPIREANCRVQRWQLSCGFLRCFASIASTRSMLIFNILVMSGAKPRRAAVLVSDAAFERSSCRPCRASATGACDLWIGIRMAIWTCG